MDRIPFLLAILLPLCASAQELVVDGKVKVAGMDIANTVDSVVVWQADSTLAIRHVSTLSEFQILSISNDTLYLSNGGYVPLPINSNSGWTVSADTTYTNKKVVMNNGWSGPGVEIKTEGGYGAIRYYLSGIEKFTLTSNNLGDLQLRYINPGPSDNLFLGAGTGDNILHTCCLEGYDNTGVGNYSLSQNTTGSFNTAFGRSALFSNSEGSNNVSIGAQSLFGNTYGMYNVALGAFSLQNNREGSQNVAVGDSSLYSSSDSEFNTAIGSRALRLHSLGNYNVAIGSNAGYHNTSGSSNVGIGHGAMEIATGSNNVAIGKEAGKVSSGDGNVFLGYNAGLSATGSNKLYIQNSDADQDNTLIYGEFDNKLVRISGRIETKDSTVMPSIRGIKTYAPGINQNIPGVYGENIIDDNYGTGVFGKGAHTGVSGNASQSGGSGQYNGVIGEATGVNTGTNYGVYGIASGAATNYAIYADGNMAYTGTLSMASDRKFKSNIKAMSGVIGKIMMLTPSTYNMRNNEFPGMNLPETVQTGFVAQDMQQVFPSLVSSQYHTNQSFSNNRSDSTIVYLGVNYIGLIPVLTRGMQEQQEIILEQSNQIENQEKRIAQLEKAIEMLMDRK